jgi:hypothetical protein
VTLRLPWASGRREIKAENKSDLDKVTCIATGYSRLIPLPTIAKFDHFSTPNQPQIKHFGNESP